MRKEELLKRFLQYNTYLRHLAGMRLHCPMDAEDAVQAAFLRAWLYCESLESEASFFSWLTRILVNECNNILRKKKRVSEVYIGDDLLLLSAGAQSEESIVTRMDLHTALVALENRYRIPIRMIFFHGLTSEEAAARLHMTRSAVSGMVRRGKERLREIM